VVFLLRRLWSRVHCLVASRSLDLCFCAARRSLACWIAIDAVLPALSIFMILKARRAKLSVWVNFFITDPPAFLAFQPLPLARIPVAMLTVRITLLHGGSAMYRSSQTTANHTEPKWLRQEYFIFQPLCAEWRQAQSQHAKLMLTRTDDAEPWLVDDWSNSSSPLPVYMSMNV
jgi:hypothetical protein